MMVETEQLLETLDLNSAFGAADCGIYRVILSLGAPNYCLCIQSNSAGFSFVNIGRQVHLKHARRHFERNLVKDVHHRSVASGNWLKSYRQRGTRSNAWRLLFFWGLLKGKVYKNALRTIEQLKDAIRQEIQVVNIDSLGKVFQNLEKCIPVCLVVKGDQFQHRLWADPVPHRSRYVYINFQVIISIT